MTWRTDVIDGPIPTYQFLGLDANGTPQFGEQLPAYNLNIAPQIMRADLEAFRIEPTHPKRVFAGAETLYLTFASEAAAIAALGDYWTTAIV